MRGLKKYCFYIIVAGMSWSCSPGSKDQAIKADITAKAKESLDFAGVSYTVEKGTVTLSGLAPTEESKQKAETTVKQIAGVKKVSNAIAIGPVVLDADFPIKLKVDSILKKYNRAQAQVENNTVIVTGQVLKKELPQMLSALRQLPVEHIHSQVTTD